MDVADFGHAELLTPCLTDSLALFLDMMGMKEWPGRGQRLHGRLAWLRGVPAAAGNDMRQPLAIGSVSGHAVTRGKSLPDASLAQRSLP